MPEIGEDQGGGGTETNRSSSHIGNMVIDDNAELRQFQAFKPSGRGFYSPDSNLCSSWKEAIATSI